LATLFHWGYPTITRASLHRVYRTMEWPWHPQIRLWWNHAPYWHYAWTHQTALALPRTIETESLLRVWTAAQVATYWPVSAATIRRTVWSAIPTTVRHFRVHGRLIATRVASGDDCETWRSQHHPEWPPLPGDTDPLLEDDPSYRWDPETRQLLSTTPSMLL
jgi:hypothetical protein